MTISQDFFFSLCVEGFLYGVYLGIFALYFQFQSINSTERKTIVFYAICLLYVLSTASFVSDLVSLVLETRISENITSIGTVQGITSGCCDFLAQCILIYRCWIVWGQSIRVVIIPSFFAVAYLATWAVPILKINWIPLTTTSFALSMAVNSLATGLIAFRILRVFLDVKAASTSVERSLGSTGGAKFRHITFIIIESGMTLFVIQLVRTMLYAMPYVPGETAAPVPLLTAFQYANAVVDMCNGMIPTIIMVRISLKLSFYNEVSFKEAVGSLCFNHSPTYPNTLQQIESSMLPQDTERNEDI